MATPPKAGTVGTRDRDEQADREKDARSRERDPNVNPSGDPRTRDARDRQTGKDDPDMHRTGKAYHATRATGGDATPAHEQTAYSPVDTSTGEPKAVGGEDTVQAGVMGSDPQVVDFDLDPEVKRQLDSAGAYRPLLTDVNPEGAASGEQVPRSLTDPGVGHKPFSGGGSAGPDVLSEPNAKFDPSQPKPGEPVDKEAAKTAVREPSTRTPESRK